MTHKPIYLDNHATTPVDPRVISAMTQYMERDYGNPSSADHVFGDNAATALDEARHHVAQLVGTSPEAVLFTSGATESANLAISGFVKAKHRTAPKPVRILLTRMEHKAVLETCQALEATGSATLRYLECDKCGRVDLNELEARCNVGADLVCIMAANNEVGNIYPIRQTVDIAHKYNAMVFTDASQAAGKIPIGFDDWNADLLALSGHKFYGPKGVGALVVAPGIRIAPLMHGGGQERGLRPGTANVPGIVGIGEAARLRVLEMANDEARIGELRNRMQDDLKHRFPDMVINGDQQNRLNGNLHVSFPGIPAHAIIARVRHVLAVSTGSACTSGIERESHVLRAMGLPPALAEGAIRIGLGKYNTPDDIREAAAILVGAAEQVKGLLD